MTAPVAVVLLVLARLALGGGAGLGRSLFPDPDDVAAQRLPLFTVLLGQSLANLALVSSAGAASIGRLSSVLEAARPHQAFSVTIYLRISHSVGRSGADNSQKEGKSAHVGRGGHFCLLFVLYFFSPPKEEKENF